MKSRTIAIAGSVAALVFAAGPITAFAAAQPHHRPAVQSRLDRSPDVKGARHVDKFRDISKSRAHSSRDSRDR
jgi:hypothetical protein